MIATVKALVGVIILYVAVTNNLLVLVTRFVVAIMIVADKLIVSVMEK